jgi:hypothetical protein
VLAGANIHFSGETEKIDSTPVSTLQAEITPAKGEQRGKRCGELRFPALCSGFFRPLGQSAFRVGRKISGFCIDSLFSR